MTGHLDVASMFDGSSWSAPVQIDDGVLVDVSCPTAGFCTALDGAGYVLNLHRAG